ncbi:T9SS type A sorting domain-containing protein [Flavobacterium lacus]|uniref:Putative secreted protein (Por secretion system target) n=1 Tax=Flavobacterium lacus TaxID=1353778 RepID=A0A328WS72_9FLAO|nr:T9SS type A sorting domain-containing protein [Flavobacterium lacus]RAR46208.1 putative secreted protein (Por secretion system target) [Flavobacterium lacus]
METKQLRFFGLFNIVLLFFSHLTFGQVNMTATGSYTQNFNTLATSGTTNTFTNNSTLPSWYIQREDNNANPNIYAADNGGSSTGRFYSYGTGTNSDRALGILNSGSTDDAAIGLLLRNTSGVTITSITVTYTLEQWRKGASATQGITFRYRTSSSSFSDLNENSDSGWTSVSALDANGPLNSGSSGSRDGNSPSNRVTRTSISIPGLSLANGDYIMLRWRDIDHSSDDHGFGIDDVTVNYTVPSIILLNDITTDNNSANPFTTNQVVDVNATASGIGRGPGISYESENGAYGANGWTTDNSIDGDDYFYWTITPNVGYQLNFESFDYEEERRDNDAPEDFSFRSSLNYGSSILTYNLTNENSNTRSIDLGASQYQSVQSAITFRLYGWDAPGGPPQDREYRINNFVFLGTVTMIPPTVANNAPTAICDNGSGSVTITGNNLIHVSSVTVGGTPVTIDSQTNTQLVVTVPQGVSGLLTVTNDAGSANGATLTLLNAVTYYADVDGDGFGDAASSISNCTGQPVGYVTNSLDCDDNLLLYEDLDADGFGSFVLVACGGVTNNLDTDDNLLTYVDADTDGFGSSILAPSGVTDTTDCDDTNNTVYPGAAEICYDGLDNDCDGIIDNGCTPIVSVVLPNQCNTTLPFVNSYVYAALVPGAQGYRFRVTNTATNDVQTIDQLLRAFRFTQLTTYAFNTTYSVEVSVRINNVWQPFYGTPCTVSTPDTTTQVQASQCNSTLSNLNNSIIANIVPFATGYRFRITNTLNPIDVQTIDRPIRDFRMSSLSNIQFNTTYNVDVAVRNTDGTYLSYGPVCNITTPLFPTIGLQDAQCDEYQVISNTETLFAESYPGVEQYRFLLENVSQPYSQTFDRLLRTVTLNNFTGLLPGTAYTVRVAIRLNGVWGPYGKSCSIITPGAGRPDAVSRMDATNVNEFKAIAYPNPFATSFAIDVKTSNTEPVRLTVYDMTGRLLEATEVKAQDATNYQFGEGYPTGVYNLVVTQGNETRTVRLVKQ